MSRKVCAVNYLKPIRQKNSIVKVFWFIVYFIGILAETACQMTANVFSLVLAGGIYR